MGRRKGICGALLLGLVLATGCGVRFPEMTTEQEEKIAEYAARAVMRHMQDYDSRLVDLSLYEEKDITDVENPSEDNRMDETADTPTVDISGEGSSLTLEEVFSLTGVEIQYTGYLVADTYPEAQGDNPYFALDATEGKKLLVLRFTLHNMTAEAVELDIFSMAPKATVTVNDTVRKNAMSTMLLDDLGTFVGSIDGGEEMPMVLLAEIDQNAAADIRSLRLTVRTDVGTATVLLQDGGTAASNGESSQLVTAQPQTESVSELTGTWCMEMDVASIVQAELGPDYTGFAGSMPIKVFIDFSENGTYHLYVDQEQMQESFSSYLEEFMTYNMGSIEDVYDAFAEQGISKEEADAMVKEQYGCSMEEYLQLMKTEAGLTENADFAAMLSEGAGLWEENGYYMVDGNQIYMGVYGTEEGKYNTYTISGNTLTMEVQEDEGNGGSGETGEFYTLVFSRVQ